VCSSTNKIIPKVQTECRINYKIRKQNLRREKVPIRLNLLTLFTNSLKRYLQSPLAAFQQQKILQNTRKVIFWAVTWGIFFTLFIIEVWAINLH